MKNHLNFVAMLLATLCLTEWNGPLAAAAELETDISTTIRAPTDFPDERSRSGYDFASTLTFETSGTAMADVPVATAAAYIFQPKLSIGRWDLEASATLCYNQYFSTDPSTDLVPDGNFDNHVLSVAKAWGPFEFGIAAALPANQAARDMTYRGSIGPVAKATVNFDRLTLSESLSYQHRSFNEAADADGIYRDAEAFKSLLEVGYQLTDALAISGSSLAVFTVAPDHSDYGIRSQLSFDYRAPMDFTTSCGVAIERGVSTLEGVQGKTDLAQAFIDVIVEL